MCHDIEDPTFDGTAIATNPRARMRPVHRPPRVPVDRAPHCEWTVFIDHDAEPLTEPAVTQALRRSQLAQLHIARQASLESGGMDFYTGTVFEQLHFEQLSHAALVVICKEIAVQNHLLILGLMMAIAQQYGEDAARTIAEFQMAGSGWVMSERLKKWLHVDSGGIDNILRVLAVHPAFQPQEYHGITMQKIDTNTAHLHIAADCLALQEQAELNLGWYTLLPLGKTAGLEGILKGVDARATLVASHSPLQWTISVDEQASLNPEPLAVQIAKGTVLYQTQLVDHIPLLQL
jgi:hypothetical protein